MRLGRGIARRGPALLIAARARTPPGARALRCDRDRPGPGSARPVAGAGPTACSIEAAVVNCCRVATVVVPAPATVRRWRSHRRTVGREILVGGGMELARRRESLNGAIAGVAGMHPPGDDWNGPRAPSRESMSGDGSKPAGAGVMTVAVPGPAAPGAGAAVPDDGASLHGARPGLGSAAGGLLIALESLAVLALAAAFRVPGLGEEALHDELYNYLAAVGYTEDGSYRIVEGAAPYVRGAIFTRAVAALLSVFGPSLPVARIPALL